MGGLNEGLKWTIVPGLGNTTVSPRQGHGPNPLNIKKNNINTRFRGILTPDKSIYHKRMEIKTKNGLAGKRLLIKNRVTYRYFLKLRQQSAHNYHGY